ncbi:hypothetical protein BEN47_05715 [Hymenobacter lapidarius]|uniref:PAC domain-containing protein n=1 Tax=Hymenobacter lapidarius TaxID=1908237 RepID=A0A1G1SS56_9BACT|nr:hypothetical protein [Hymenobacter lapidarius]OGX81444.1 hypothetical protein BEN47_05715 [Hymenobacter lapidarius]
MSFTDTADQPRPPVETALRESQAREEAARADAQAGLLTLGYYKFTYQPLHDALGQVTGLITVGIEVTGQVLARQDLQQLNHELEARVQLRTHEAEAARAEAEEQRNRLLRLFGQAPAQINLFAGPGHVWTLVHPHTQELLPTRPLLGRPRRQALPELPSSSYLTKPLTRDKISQLLLEYFPPTQARP